MERFGAGTHNSAAVRSGSLVFVSGQIAEGETLEIQLEKIFENLQEFLRLADSNLYRIVKINVYLTTMDDFPAMCEVYKKYITHLPARTTIAAGLYGDSKVEIECVAEV